MFTKIKFLVVGSLRIARILPSWMVGITYETKAGETEYDSFKYFRTLAAAEEETNQRAKDLLDEGFTNVKAAFVRPRNFTVNEDGLGLVHVAIVADPVEEDVLASSVSYVVDSDYRGMAGN
jgi:hypothetical protein